jgi:hypothetical protein
MPILARIWRNWWLALLRLSSAFPDWKSQPSSP